MNYRQVHLDFHTSEAIRGIGKSFSKAQFQEMLRLGHVDSITVFSKCHHGWAYHPSEANEMHPHLDFDLLGAQIEAAHEIGVKTPVYLSAGLDEKLARKQPGWLGRSRDDQTCWTRGFMEPGYHLFCMNTPYLDVLVTQIEEVVRRYDADGIFLDIVGVQPCYCQYCVAAVRSEGGDPRDEQAMRAVWERTYMNYARRTNDAVHRHRPDLHVFHNTSHMTRGRRDLAAINGHLELESLPTGGWGYDHFPLSARYAETLGMDYLGMTGKFHLSWGEFGGYKHPNALRYETALSAANGARCSVGDQLHPNGLMDEATYALIGEAYGELEKKEPWLLGSAGIADVALLSLESVIGRGAHEGSDVGALRMLLEGHYLYDVIDREADFSRYRVLILPDHARSDDELRAKLAAYADGGGKVFASGVSALCEEGTFAVDLGAQRVGECAIRPSYFRPDFRPGPLLPAAFVMYEQGQEAIAAPGASVWGVRENAYFNRDLFAFSSHRHTPNPQGTELPYEQQPDPAGSGRHIVSYTVPELECHAMVVLEFE
ncbi:beta-galactosidase trimerization domain-containing protein [Paenibacillus arenilitoris]|uniref:Beta-galactosidase trimerization domain-containing protein n=1 Tax=Paenibacillus arenilitoris TaxID=2772299 RepID=A0A927H5Q6_9BACL|nr:beta-galactosidase trimerization domain-containing protein [Paenibacillus arenilitoris]MBD2868682.1 beta-galactosidase trimerization domain-containing protein [Paenibacillus arenilitoris]